MIRNEIEPGICELIDMLQVDGYHFWHNEETGEYLISIAEEQPRGIEPHDLLQLRAWAGDRGISLPQWKLSFVIEYGAKQNAIRPIRDNLLVFHRMWDQRPVIDRLADCIIPPAPIPPVTVRRALSDWLLGAVQRVWDGIPNKILILDGSSWLGWPLALWLGAAMTDACTWEYPDPNLHRCARDLTRTLVWCLDDITHAIIAFATRQTVTMRHGRTRTTLPVLASFIAVCDIQTTHRFKTIRDDHMLVVPIKDIDQRYTDIDPCDLWGEAVTRYLHGERPSWNVVEGGGNERQYPKNEGISDKESW